jgi:hypothetical protein
VKIVVTCKGFFEISEFESYMKCILVVTQEVAEALLFTVRSGDSEGRHRSGIMIIVLYGIY